jgi:hypothetical protein
MKGGYDDEWPIERIIAGPLWFHRFEGGRVLGLLDVDMAHGIRHESEVADYDSDFYDWLGTQMGRTHDECNAELDAALSLLQIPIRRGSNADEIVALPHFQAWIYFRKQNHGARFDSILTRWGDVLLACHFEPFMQGEVSLIKIYNPDVWLPIPEDADGEIRTLDQVVSGSLLVDYLKNRDGVLLYQKIERMSE